MLKASLSEQVYEIMRGRIVSGKAPPGERIDVRKLAEEFHISQTPVRFALNRLHDTGLVENRPRIGYFVIKVSEKDLIDTYDLRELFEVYALKSAVQNLDISVWQALKRKMLQIYALKKKDEQRKLFYETDENLHLTIVEGSDNRKARELFMQIYDGIRVSFFMGTQWEESLKVHLSILDALIEKDAKRATTLLRDHIRDSKKSAVRQIKSKSADTELSKQS